ncbi:MAG: hypothetical protein A2603_04015 [Bdellovibrionales bacterium RIFOXYD1_FULL_55_31]|nr:MAG: hypothetical protein A2603_04015 [Bdellovibrionales bacterium RIFOXYD1_FULL_55_31]
MFNNVIRQTRRNLGLTQAKLSQISGVSLPFIQNMEAGRANPSVGVLGAVLAPLGLTLEIGHAQPNWDDLAALGVPLISKSGTRKIPPTPEALLQGLTCACFELRSSGSSNDPRKREAIQAVILAIMIHFPRFFERCARIPGFAEFIPEQPTARLIKLSRQALSVLATYL